MSLDARKQRLIHVLLDAGVLQFGEFTLKSGRVSPYFFNLGSIFYGKPFHTLAIAYAQAIKDHFSHAQVLFGPAYKGIPLASATSICCFENHLLELGVAFDRKEAKDHGEGGLFVGAALQGQIVMIDDVITAGTAVNSALEKIKAHAPEAQVKGLVVAMDRQESVIEPGPSAIESLQQKTGLEVHALLCLQDLIDFMSTQNGDQSFLPAMLEYRQRFGAKNVT